MADNLDKRIEVLFVNAQKKIDGRMSIERVPKDAEMEVRVFGEGTSYEVLVKAMATANIGQNQGGTIIYREEIKDPELAVMLGDRFSQYLTENGHKCPVDMQYLSDEAKQKLGIPITPKT